jgi:hypothetical protein
MDGTFALMNVPTMPGVELHITAVGRWGALYRIDVPPGGIGVGDIGLLDDVSYAGRLATVTPPRSANPSTGTIVLEATMLPIAAGVERGVLSVSSDPTLVPGATGFPNESPTLFPGVPPPSGFYFEFTGVLPGVWTTNIVGSACIPGDGNHTVRAIPGTITYLRYFCG